MAMMRGGRGGEGGGGEGIGEGEEEGCGFKSDISGTEGLVKM